MSHKFLHRRLIVACLVAILWSVVWPLVTLAHPLGNFTINRYSRLELTSAQIQLHYVIDIAEVPAVTELKRLDQDGDHNITPVEQDRYLEGMVFALQQNLRLQVDGQAVAFVPQRAALDLPPGQGGLRTVRLMIDYAADLPDSTTAWQVDYQDGNYADRELGWQEIIVQSKADVNLLESSVPSEDVSQELRNYPEALLQEPLQVDQATFRFIPTALETTEPADVAAPEIEAEAETEAVPAAPAADSGDLSKPTEPFADLMTLPLTGPGIVIFILLASFGWGALHALSPGHGKTVVAAYLIGSRGTLRHALFLGLTTTVTHTAGVFALGAMTLFISQFILPEQLYPWLSVTSGLLVVVVGLSLLSGRWRQLRGSSAEHLSHHHDHIHDHHHPHPHDHDHEQHGHSHLPPGADGSPITWRSLLALGVSGGLLPCPSALILMLSAIALGRVGFGLLLIFIFSLGLASVLTVIGLLFVYAGQLFNRFPHAAPLLPALPLVSALVVTVLGVGITVQALLQIGITPY